MKPSTSHPRRLLTLWVNFGLLLLGIAALTPAHTSGHLIKRAKDTPYGKDKLSFNQAAEKGNEWICNLANDPPANRQTQFTDYNQLKTNGWADSGDHPDPNTLDELKELTDPLKAIGVQDQSKFQSVGMLQNLPFGNNEQPTEAQYLEDYETNQGVIVATNNYSPSSVSPGEPIPDLRAWSDVVFLTWANLCSKGGDIKSIKHIFRRHIKADETSTLGIALEALGVQSADNVQVWPPGQPEITGQTFTADSDEGKALIGTPHGVGIGWFMWQHRGDQQLGKKTFDKVTVFKTTDDQGKAWVNIHYLLKDL